MPKIPIYIHCLEEKDRAAFVSMMLEALCGTSYEEIIDEYFITYQNYYGLEKDTDTYKLIGEVHIDTMINYVLTFNDESNNENTNKYQTAAYNYLKATGLTNTQLEQCIKKLTTI